MYIFNGTINLSKVCIRPMINSLLLLAPTHTNPFIRQMLQILVWIYQIKPFVHQMSTAAPCPCNPNSTKPFHLPDVVGRRFPAYRLCSITYSHSISYAPCTLYSIYCIITAASIIVRQHPRTKFDRLAILHSSQVLLGLCTTHRLYPNILIINIIILLIKYYYFVNNSMHSH